METNQAPAQGTCNCEKPRPGYKFVEIPIDTYVWTIGPFKHRVARIKPHSLKAEVAK